MSASIPMTGDVAALIGRVAERVENRSLLLDKFPFHKKWPEEVNDEGREIKWDEASRWSFMRIADGAGQLLAKEADAKRRAAGGKNREAHNKDRLLAEAAIAESLAAVKWDSRELQNLRARHTRQFLAQFRAAYGSRASVTIGQLEGRLAINLADSLIQNAGICLDRLFGLPYIPGSAVKGASRAAALEEITNAPAADRAGLLETFCLVFGTAENDFQKGDLREWKHLLPSHGDLRGAVCFLPAYPLNEAKIVVDLTNVHYPTYYGGDKKRNISAGLEASLKEEKPQPNPFPVVETGAQFAFCLVQQSGNPELLAAAARWLAQALTIRGLGAKTASGYGWFSLKPQVLAEMEAASQKEAADAAARADAARLAEIAAQEEAARKSQLSPAALAAETLLALSDEQFAAFAKDIAAKSETEQRAFLTLLTTSKDKRERWKIWKKKKPELTGPLTALCTQLQLPPLP